MLGRLLASQFIRSRRYSGRCASRVGKPYALLGVRQNC
nr:hypothetical protein [Escherichia coli]